MQHAEELAGEYGTAELWALHSDRIARGDGRVARHAVEIALWALKSRCCESRSFRHASKTKDYRSEGGCLR
jgi:hypothetical protein